MSRFVNELTRFALEHDRSRGELLRIVADHPEPAQAILRSADWKMPANDNRAWIEALLAGGDDLAEFMNLEASNRVEIGLDRPWWVDRGAKDG